MLSYRLPPEKFLFPQDTRVADPWPEDTSKDGCDVVYDDVWEEKCTTVYTDTKCYDEKDR